MDTRLIVRSVFFLAALAGQGMHPPVVAAQQFARDPATTGYEIPTGETARGELPPEYSNRCMSNVEEAFSAEYFPTYFDRDGDRKFGSHRRFRIVVPKGSSLPPDGEEVFGPGGFRTHVESIVRVDGPPDTNDDVTLVMSRLSKSRASFAVLTVNSDSMRMISKKRIDTSKHIGGMQALGNLVGMPVTCDKPTGCRGRASVQFWDFNNRLNPSLINEVHLDPPADKAHWLAMTYLADGRLLVVVNRSNNGSSTVLLSVDAATNLRSIRNTDFRPSGWHLYPQISLAVEKWNTNDNGPYQNVNFVRSCESGRLYLVGMRQKHWTSKNQLEVFRVDLNLPPIGVNQTPASPPFSLTHVVGGRFFGQLGEHCEFRAGSGVYVGYDHQPRVYCSKGATVGGFLVPRILKVAELRSSYSQ